MSLGELRSQTGLVGLWHLNGNSNDSSGNSNNGTDTNITYSQANGKFGQGAGFSPATDSRISLPFGPSGYQKAITINTWVKGTAGSMEDYAAVVLARSGDNSNATGLAMGASGYGDNTKVHFMINSQESNTPAFVVSGGWHMVTGVYDGSNIMIYGDGILVGQAAYTSNIATTGNFYIGGDPYSLGNRTFAGCMDEVSIFNVAKSASWVRQQYAIGKWGEL